MERRRNRLASSTSTSPMKGTLWGCVTTTGTWHSRFSRRRGRSMRGSGNSSIRGFPSFTICALIRLSAEGIAGPETKLWNDTTIRGHLKRGTGIINNELYLGRRVWNRLHYVKNPSTGKRVSRLNPESEWIVTEVPEL